MPAVVFALTTPYAEEQMEHLRYTQTSGRLELIREDGTPVLLGTGWAGNGKGKNNPAMQNVREVGPLPQGWYMLAEPIAHPTLGPIAFKLTPDASNEMFGRDAFWIHGPSAKHYGQESKGCIIENNPVRQQIRSLKARRLEVVK